MFSEFCSFRSALCQSHRRKHQHRQIEKIGVGGAQCHLPNKGTPDRGKESSNYLYSNRKRTTAAAKWKSGEGWREIFIISFPQQFLCGIWVECILPRKLSLPEKGCWCGWWECPECGHFHVGAGGWSGGRSPEVLVQRCCAGKGPGMQLWSWPPPPSPGTNGSEHRKSPSRGCQRLTPTLPLNIGTPPWKPWALSWSRQHVQCTQHLPCSSVGKRKDSEGTYMLWQSQSNAV